MSLLRCAVPLLRRAVSLRHGVLPLSPARRARPALLLLLLPGALLLSGCFRAEMEVGIDDAGRADLVFLAAFDASTPGLTARADQAQLSGPELFAELGVDDVCGSAPGGALEFTPEPFTQGSLRGVRCTATGVDVRDLDLLSADGTRLVIRQPAGSSRWEFALTLPEALPAAGSVDTSELLRLEITVSAPGRLSGHNGVAVYADTVRWDLSSPEEVPGRLFATWAPNPEDPAPESTMVGGTAPSTADDVGSLPPPVLVLLVVLTFSVPLTAGLVARRMLRRRGSTHEPELPRAGWYRDPASPTGRRFWDGSSWTDRL